MATTTVPTSTSTKPTRHLKSFRRSDGFEVVTSDASLGYNLPQRVGRKLWLPMFAMALMGWGTGFTLSIVEASTSRSSVDDLQTLSHLVPAFMFVGFMGVFSAITFAIARILGAFRKGGGEVQSQAGAPVQTLKMLTTAKIMLALMMMGMMIMGAGIITNFVGAASFNGTDPSDIISSAQYGAVGSGLRRLGTASYLVGIAFGLSTIVEVLRFQSSRIGELASNRV